MELKQGDLENLILNALWDLENEGVAPIFVGQVQTRIELHNRRWAYTTVKTVLDRLVDKDIVVRSKEGKRFFYKSTLERTQVAKEALKKVMRQYFKNDMDELLSMVAVLREEGVGVRMAVDAGLVSESGKLLAASGV